MTKSLTEIMMWNQNKLYVMIGDENYLCEDIEAYIHQCRRRDGVCRDLFKRHFLSGRTVLMHAVRHGRIRVISVLLDAKAELDAIDHRGNTALHYAIEHERLDILKVLCQKVVPLELPNQKGLTPIQFAYELGQLDTVLFLIDRGANLDNTFIHTNQTLLMMSVMAGQHRLIHSLIHHGAELDFQDRVSGRSALMHAVCLNDRKSIEMLLEAGANVLLTDHHGHSVWEEALLLQDQSLIQLLMKYGAALGKALQSSELNLTDYDLQRCPLLDVAWDGVPAYQCFDELGHALFSGAFVTVSDYVEAHSSHQELKQAVKRAVLYHVFDVPKLRYFDRHTVKDRKAMVSFVLSAERELMPGLKSSGLAKDAVKVKMDYLERIGDLLTPLERIVGFVDKMDVETRDAFGDLCMAYTELSSQAGTLDERQHVYRLIPKGAACRSQGLIEMIEHEYEKVYRMTLSPLIALKSIEPLYHELGFDFDLDKELTEKDDFQGVHVNSESASHVQSKLFLKILAARQELEKNHLEQSLGFGDQSS